MAVVDYKIKKILPHDKPKIKDFLHDNYFPFDPELLAMNISATEVHPSQDEFILSAIDEGYSYAIVTEDGTILAVLLMAELTKNCLINFKRRIENSNSEYFTKLLKYYYTCQDNAKILEASNCDKALNFNVAATLLTARKRGLMKRLFQHGTELAKQNGYKLITTCAASNYTARLCRSLNWTCVFCLPYISVEQNDKTDMAAAHRLIDTVAIYEIRTLLLRDKPKIKAFLRTAFHPHDPELKAMGVKEIHPSYEDSIVNTVDEGYSYAAVARDDTILGALLMSSEFISRNTFTNLKKEIEQCRVEYFRKLLKHYYTMLDSAKILEIANCDQAMHFSVGATSPAARGHGIMRQLMEHGIEVAKQSDYKLVTCYCASEYTARLCQSLGWSCVYCVPYTSIEQNGEKIFKNPVYPHLYSRMYARYLK